MAIRFKAYLVVQGQVSSNLTGQAINQKENPLALLPDNHELLIDISMSLARANRQAQAAKYARQCVKVLNTAAKPEGTDDKVWKDYTNNGLANCYAIVGNVAYEQKDYSTAIANLENSVKYFKRNGLAYYYLGLSYWQQNKVWSASAPGWRQPWS